MLETEQSKNINAVIIREQNENFLFNVENVKEIFVPGERIIAVPLADKSIVGIIDIRGNIYTILSLKHILFNKESSYDLNGISRLLLMEYRNLKIALLVESVIGVKEFPDTIFEGGHAIVKTDIDVNYIKSIGIVNGQSFILINLDAFLQPFLTLEEGKTRTIPAILPKILEKPKIRPATTKDIKEKVSTVITPKPKGAKAKSSKSKVKMKVEKDKIQLNKVQQDLLQEIGNIGCGNAVTALSRLIKKKINVNLTDVGIISFDNLTEQFGTPKEKICGIFSHITKPSQSTILQVFEMKSLLKLINSLLGEKSQIDPEKISTKSDLDEYAISTITEMGNIMAGHYVSAISDLIKIKIMIDIPQFTMSEPNLLGDFLSKEFAEISDFLIIIKTAIDITDFKLSGFFFLIPDIDTLELFFNKLGIEYQPQLVGEKSDKETEIIEVNDIKLTEVQRDALQEVGNIGAGNAANALAKMINKRVDINIPSVEMVELDKYAEKVSKKNEKLLVSWSNITGKTRATILSIFNIKDMIELTAIIVDDQKKKEVNLKKKIEKVQDFPEIYQSAMSELGHILGSHYTSAIGDLLGIRLMVDVPDMNIDTGKKLFTILKDEIGILKKLSLVITTNVIVTDFKITGTFLFIPDLDTLQVLLDALENFYG